jgi:hypothetical protein
MRLTTVRLPEPCRSSASICSRFAGSIGLRVALGGEFISIQIKGVFISIQIQGSKSD